MDRKSVTSLGYNQVSRGIALSFGALALVGCISPQVVGESEPGSENHNTLTEQTGDGTDCKARNQGDPSCSDADARGLSDYNTWACAPNELGSLAGTEWRLESGPWTSTPAYSGHTLTLRFETDGKSTFEVGTPVAPVAEVGHLCSGREEGSDYCSLGWKQQFPVGAAYPLHGISQTGDGWTVPFRYAGYLNEWCGLQTPRADDVACGFSLAGNNGARFGPACIMGEECNLTFDGPDGGLYGTACSLGNESGDGVYHVVEEKDCGWTMLAMRLGETCTCTSSYCFSSASSTDSEWRLAPGADSDVLVLTSGEAELEEEHLFRRVP